MPASAPPPAGRRPLRIGILGAARIADLAMLGPARRAGHEVVAVAASSTGRAATFAAEHGIPRSFGGYAELLSDPDVELVYNPLVNSMHREWNIRALAAGKHVLSEKPFTANASQAYEVRAAASGASGRIFEGFHYLHHPVARRMLDLAVSGELGRLQSTSIVMEMAAPPDIDPRLSYPLAGGVTMDLGCYALHALRRLGRQWGGEPEVTAAAASRSHNDPDVDTGMAVALTYPVGIEATASWDMTAEERRMEWTLVGDRGSATALCWPLPHLDDRIVIDGADGRRFEALGDRTSYDYQMDALTATLLDAADFPTDVADAVANMELVDQVYTLAGLPVRGAG